MCALALAAAGWAATTPSSARAAAGDIGYEGPSTVGAQTALTGEKPESKLWWNDGIWWASMWSQSASAYHIFRLNLGSQSWVDTGVALDNRSSSRADTLWDANSGKLYVASHVFSTGSSSGNPARLYRYGYNAATETYSLDAGFPVQIGNYKTEALTIAKDSTGQLWATWKQGTTFMVNASVCNPACNDAVWGTPFTPDVPGTKTSFDSDDNAAVIAFAGKVGVFWSNQTNGTDYFAVHDDSDSDAAWTGETALSGPDMADDHMNLKTDSNGRVYAVVKTSRGGSTDPLVMLLVRSTSGSWTNTTVGLKRDHHTRAIVELDEVDQTIHVFATSPESGGSIYEKTSPMGSISFPGGTGTVVMEDASGKLNNSSSTKQNVSPATGLVVLASSGQNVYFHQYFSLGGGGGGGTSPTAAFSATPTSGAAPLSVQFTDTSSGAPTAWQWDFQNDGTIDSTTQDPSFVYASPGTYSVRLTVANTSGSDSLTKSGYITVTAAGATLTFTPTDDAFVRSNNPNENNGSLDTLRSWKGSGQTNSFLKFNVSGLTGTVTAAKLRLFVVTQSPKAGDVYPVVDNSWTEGAITWATSPAIGSTRIGQGGPATLGTWVEIDLGSAISGNGTVSLALVGASNTAAWFSSAEGANPPQLVLTQSGGGGGGTSPTAAFSATPTSGAAPLSVQFTDTSSGAPTAWQWDFQNDGTVDSTQQNPSVSFATPGTYSVKLTVANTAGSDSLTKSGYITVTAAGPTLAFTPTDDAFVRSNHPDENNGDEDTLRSWKGSGQTNSFLKFNVSGLTGTVTTAKLRLFVVTQSPKAGDVYPVVGNSWTEGAITWATSPVIGSTRIGQGGPASLGTWIEIDLGSAISGNGTVSLALVGASNTAAWFSSAEGATPPQLVLTQS